VGSGKVRGAEMGGAEGSRAAERPFLEGARAFHREHGVVDVLAVLGRQRLIRVQLGRSRSEIAVLAVHEGELSAVDRLA
jgi:hypothetical protein